MVRVARGVAGGHWPRDWNAVSPPAHRPPPRRGRDAYCVLGIHRVRMALTCFTGSGDFGPKSLPLFQGSCLPRLRLISPNVCMIFLPWFVRRNNSCDA